MTDFNNLGRVLDIIKNSMKPKYQFVFDENMNVIFLDYSEYGPEYANYSYRWVWHKLRGGPNDGDWVLIPFPQYHHKSLDLLSHEVELAKQAYQDILNYEKDGNK